MTYKFVTEQTNRISFEMRSAYVEGRWSAYWQAIHDQLNTLAAFASQVFLASDGDAQKYESAIVSAFQMFDWS